MGTVWGICVQPFFQRLTNAINSLKETQVALSLSDGAESNERAKG